MSIENKKTLEVYDVAGKVYLENSIKHDMLDLEKAKRKKDKLHEFIRKSFEVLPIGSKIIEIGSANGENAKYISSLGYTVTASDIANCFLDEIKKAGFDPIKFNVIEDEFPGKFFGIFCWKVFVHFTKGDALKVLKKSYLALEENGIFIFNVINREVKQTDEEWVDFPKEYHMGVMRYYNYYYKEDLDKMIKDVGFEIIDFRKEGGEDNNKWLVYVLKKHQ